MTQPDAVLILMQNLARESDDQDELIVEALESFYQDIRSSFKLAGATQEQLDTVDSYFESHYT